MSAILKFNFQKRKAIKIFRRKISKLHKKATILHDDNYIFPITRENRTKQWTHLGSRAQRSYDVTKMLIILVKNILRIFGKKYIIFL